MDGFLNKPEGADYQFIGPDLSEKKYFGEGAGIAIRKQDKDLVEMFNKAIAQIRADGTYKKIQDKYFDTFNITNFNRKHFDITQSVSERIKDQLTDSADENKMLIRQAMANVLPSVSTEDESAQLKHMLLSLAFDADIVLDLHCDYQAVTHVYHFLQRRGLITGEAPALPDLLNDATPLRGVEHIKATTPGVVVFHKSLGECVKPGDVIAEVINPSATSEKDAVTPLNTNIEGIVISINVDRFARPGRILSKIAGKEPLSGKGETLLTA